jgi:small subunit ribosomal protein S17
MKSKKGNTVGKDSLKNIQNKLIKKFTGKVISASMEKTVKVIWEKRMPHPLYRKVIANRKKFFAHNEIGAKLGDMVEIVECRPISKLKKFKVIKIL